MKTRLTGVIYIMITFALVDKLSINVFARDNNKRRPKEKSGGFLKNICDITDRDSKVHCYCENTREPRNATKAECWVFNGGIPPDDPIWQSFASQPALQTLSFNIRVDGALGYVPTKALFDLKTLRCINIKYGNINKVTSYSFANLTHLREIMLSQNQIKTLQKYSFANLPSLTSLDLEDNMITEIPALAFFDVPKLQKLVLAKNNISSIKDGAFQHTFNLLELDLNKNSIFSLNRHAFDGLANLRKLDLRKNRIHNLTEFTFAELWNLQELLLGMNDLKFISERAFDGLSQLRKLSLEDNKLTSLPKGLFEGVRGLNSLDLHSNELYALPFENIVPILDNLKPQNSNLLLEGNNFICDCRLRWMHVLRNETKSLSTKESLDSVTCKSEPRIVSTAYNEMEPAENKLQYNQNIIHSGISIETYNAETTENAHEEIRGIIDSDITPNKIIPRKVLKIPPETLLCPKEEKSTEMPPNFINPVVPVHKEMITYRFHDINVAQKLSLQTKLLLWSCVVYYLPSR